MASIATISLVGNIGKDPQTSYTPSGHMNIRFSVAVNARRGDQESTAWYVVTAWGKLAEIIDKLHQQGAFGKGREVFVVGTLQPREYQDQNGVTRTSLDVNADHIQLVGKRDQAAPADSAVPF